MEKADLTARLRGVASNLERFGDSIQTEEATKTGLVLPFLAALGYDVFNPSEVCPEYTADVGIKKGEKADIAILRDGSPVILIECKVLGAPLSATHMSQLYRYFATTTAKLAVLTNGEDYHFFTDLESTNKLDQKPFLRINVSEVTDREVTQLLKFTKDQWDIESVLSVAEELRLISQCKSKLDELTTTPDTEFVRLIAKRIGVDRVTQSHADKLSPIITRAFSELLRDKINSRISSALSTSESPNASTATDETLHQEEASTPATESDLIETTVEEMEAFFIVKSIIRGSIQLDRVFWRDSQSYFSVLVDDSNRKPICRFHFNRKQKYVSIFDADKATTRVDIQYLDDIYALHEQLVARATLLGQG